MAVSTYASLEARLTVVEAKLAALEEQVAAMQANSSLPKRSLVQVIAGTFANDPSHAEAMKLGRQYRESLRPKPAKKRMKKPAKKAHSAKGG